MIARLRVRAGAVALAGALLAGVALSSASAAPDLVKPSDILTPAQILERYAAALKKAKSPNAMSFDYSVAQLGMRNMEQTHHVYRSTLRERDETRIVDGYVLPRPTIRIINNRVDRYDLHAVAPTTAAYTFTYAGPANDDDNITYEFKTTPIGARSFAVSDIVLDGKTFLPRLLRFKIASGSAHGSGQLAYVRADKYWVVQDARVSAHLAGGTLASEHLKWWNYQFPESLPSSTFIPPRTILAPIPDVAPTATPAPEPGAP